MALAIKTDSSVHTTVTAAEQRFSFQQSFYIRVVIAWRKSFTRQQAIDAICKAVRECEIEGVTLLDEPQHTT